MAPTSNGPYLDFPREVRLRIYHYLFHDTEISLAMHSDFGLAKCAPFESNSYSADDGITLVCRLVRAEAMPVLRRSISLYCEINNSTCTREGTLVVKSEYFKLIREAHIVLGDVGCHIPYHEMKSLEVLRLECDKEWLVLWWHPKLQDYVQWAKDSDLVKYVDSVKQTILEKWSNDKLRGMLSNPRRGFRIEWVECIYDEVIETDVVGQTELPDKLANTDGGSG